MRNLSNKFLFGKYCIIYHITSCYICVYYIYIYTYAWPPLSSPPWCGPDTLRFTAFLPSQRKSRYFGSVLTFLARRHGLTTCNLALHNCRICSLLTSLAWNIAPLFTYMSIYPSYLYLSSFTWSCRISSTYPYSLPGLSHILSYVALSPPTQPYIIYIYIHIIIIIYISIFYHNISAFRAVSIIWYHFTAEWELDEPFPHTREEGMWSSLSVHLSVSTCPSIHLFIYLTLPSLLWSHFISIVESS